MVYISCRVRQITKSGRLALKELTTLKLYMDLITHAGTYVPTCVAYGIVIIMCDIN